MNYLRGAVNAISAPYQYYRDLPPINPSTLTGAIDVIVIKRPADSGDLELACSPFHVRFGKWQVLRPGEKKVRQLMSVRLYCGTSLIVRSMYLSMATQYHST
jgi:phosphatidate phosphatase LPIN